MTVAYWVVAGILALVFLGAGLSKIVRPKDALASSGMAYVEDFSSAQIKLIGIAEVLGAVGLILPKLLDVVPALSPIAGVALGVLMLGATVVHIRRDEQFIPALLLTVVSAAAAVLGFLTLS